MRQKVILTTTTSIPNYEITESKGLVFANTVLGANLFSDFFASFTDIFGGKSGSYQSKLDEIYEDVVEKLKKKTLDMKCNAIIGFRIDFDEISGKDKSMFMVNAIGTACVAKTIEGNVVNNDDNLLDDKDMMNEMMKIKAVNKIKAKTKAVIPQEDIDYFLEHPTKDIVDDLLDCYYTVKVGEGQNYVNGVYVNDTPTRVASNVNFVNEYIGLVLDVEVEEKVYNKFAENKIFFPIIEKNNIFNSKCILGIAEKDPVSAIPLLKISKQTYSKEDLDFFKQILSMYDNLPDRGKMEMSKGGIFSKSQLQYICQEGHENLEDSEFCGTCGKNIKGLTKDDVQVLDDLKLKITILEKYFS